VPAGLQLWPSALVDVVVEDEFLGEIAPNASSAPKTTQDF
jgi:hypothetical protein